MRYMYTPKRRPHGLATATRCLLSACTGFASSFRHERVAGLLLGAVIGLVLLYVLVLADSPPEPVASSWSQVPNE